MHFRIRQQEILAELGVFALQGTEFMELLNHVVRLTAEGLEAEYCKVLEYLPAENRLLVRAGVGWGEGVVGSATVGADLASPAGFALHTGKPVISNHLENEQRFRTLQLLVEHGIRRAMNVILQGVSSLLAFLRSTANPPVNSANMMWLFCKEPRTSWGWQSSNSNLSANYKRRSIVISCFSKRSIIGSRIACKWLLACFTSRRMPLEILN